MNIFVLDRNIRKCARYHCDQHVVKMTLESVQILCTVLNERGVSTARLRGEELGRAHVEPVLGRERVVEQQRLRDGLEPGFLRVAELLGLVDVRTDVEFHNAKCTKCTKCTKLYDVGYSKQESIYFK